MLEICPLCGQAQAVSKVSAIYVAGLQAGKGASAKTLPVQVRGIAPEALPALSRRLAPPASSKQAQLRLVHPDLIVLVFSVIAPVFVVGIYQGQRPFFYPAVAGLLLAYALYFWQRGRILARFQRQADAERRKHARIRSGIQRWMNLYYCAADDVIFEPGGAPPLPADQIYGYLFQDTSPSTEPGHGSNQSRI